MLIVMLFGSVILFMYLRSRVDQDEPDVNRSDFLPNRFVAGRIRFQEIMSHDLEYNFPTTPAEVVARYSEIYNFIYSNFLDSDELLEQLVIQKRHLLSPEILANNPLENQLESLKMHLENLVERNFHYIGFRQLNVEYDRDIPTVATVTVIHYGSIPLNVRITYLLERNLEKDRWFIAGWSISEELGRSN